MYYYVTRPNYNPNKKLTIEDILFDLVSEREYYAMHKKTSTVTRTYAVKYYQWVPKMIVERRLGEDIMRMEDFYKAHKNLDIFFDDDYDYEEQFKIYNKHKKKMQANGCFDEVELEKIVKEELEKQGLKYNPYYYSFFLPKKSGGLRRIDAPCDELKDALSRLKQLFEEFMCGNTYHTSAFAYIPKRCAYDVGKKMRDNKCRWFLKTDFSDFFGSINIDFMMRQFEHIYPFSAYIREGGERGKKAVMNCLKLCFLDKRLPQGTPISPLLTNIIMIPFDYAVSNYLYAHADEITTFDKQEETELNGFRLIYARYADDIYIGSHRGFKPEPVIEYLKSVIKSLDAPFVIKPEKTKYCSNAGKNWILGLMLNQNNEITIGHQRKKQIKAMMSNFVMDYKNGIAWEPGDIQQVLGNIAYMKSVEKEYAENLIANINNKFQVDVEKLMKNAAYK